MNSFFLLEDNKHLSNILLSHDVKDSAMGQDAYFLFINLLVVS